ncbi:MAG: VTT domain-containing protein [Candidatus Micrarchaeota archaeon]
MQLEKQMWWVIAALVLSAIISLVNPISYILEHMDQLGYAGAFFVMMFSNATIFFPLPGISIVAGLATVLNPLYLGIIAGIGGGIGETTGYMFGRGSEKAILKRNPKYYLQVKQWMRRHGAISIIVLSAIPNPAFDIAGVAAGALRYDWWKFLGAVILGNIIKCYLVAFSADIASYYLGTSNIMPF